MTRRRQDAASSTLVLAAGGAIGGVFNPVVGGARLVDPTEFAWLMKLDWRIHFLWFLRSTR